MTIFNCRGNKPIHESFTVFKHKQLTTPINRVRSQDGKGKAPHHNRVVKARIREKYQIIKSRITPETLAGDKAYGYGPAVRRICEAGVKPHVAHPIKIPWNSRGIFSKQEFTYDRKRDELICPAGNRLHKRTEHSHNRQSEYAASVKDCRRCNLKEQCTRTRYRVTHRHWDQDYLDYAEAQRQTPEYRISQRCRKKIESLFGEAKEQMGLRRARRRGHEVVTEQCLMTAMVQNIKRIVTAVGKRGVGDICAALKSGLKHISDGFDHIRTLFFLMFIRLRPESILA
jgi:hypothetical protein